MYNGQMTAIQSPVEVSTILLGIDIDGVMLDFEHYIRTRGAIYCHKEIVDESGYDISDMFDVSMLVESGFWKEHILDYATEYKARPDFVQFIRDINLEEFRWVVITDRCSDLSYCDWSECVMQNYVEEFLQDIIDEARDSRFSGIYYTHGNKLEMCKKLGVGVMFEDSTKHIEVISPHVEMVKVLANYNKAIHRPSVYEVKDFTDSGLIPHLRNISKR